MSEAKPGSITGFIRRVGRVLFGGENKQPWLDLAGLAAGPPEQRDATLQNYREAVVGTRKLAAQNPAWKHQLASTLLNLSAVQHALGQPEAVASAEEALAINRVLASKNDAFGADLASAYYHLGLFRGTFGPPAAALESAEAAALLYRELADRSPEYLEPYGNSLHMVGVHQAALGQKRAARDTSIEALAVYRELVDRDFDRFAERLAAGLCNLAQFEHALHLDEEALRSAEAAFDLFRTLEQGKHPPADVLTSLNVLAICQGAAKQLQAAVETARQAVAHAHALAANDPTKDATLFRCLHNLMIHQRELHLSREARETGRAAAAVAHRLMTADIATLPPQLRLGPVEGLFGICEVEAMSGHGTEAAALGREAESHARKLLAAGQEGAGLVLASGLMSLGIALDEGGDREGARRATAEAIALFRALPAPDEQSRRLELARGLTNLGAFQLGLGLREDAFAAASETLAIKRALVDQKISDLDRRIALSLNNLAQVCAARGSREEALSLATESVALYRRVFAANGSLHLDLANALVGLAHAQRELGALTEARASAAEALAHCRQAAVADPELRPRVLAEALDAVATIAGALGEGLAALEAATEAVGRLRALAKNNPTGVAGALARMLSHLGARQLGAGSPADARASLEEAITAQRALVASNRGGFLPDLAESLHDLAAVHAAAGRRAEAAEAARASTDAYAELARACPAAFEQKLAAARARLQDLS